MFNETSNLDQTADEVAADLKNQLGATGTMADLTGGAGTQLPIVDPLGGSDTPASQQPPTAPAVTPPVQTPAAQTPATPAAEPKPWFYEEEQAATTTPPVTPATGQQQAPPVNKYAAILNDPEIQFILDQKLAGKSIYDIQKEITLVDFDKMSPAEVMAHDLKFNGASDEDVAEYMEGFKEKKMYEQNEIANMKRPFHKNIQQQKVQSVSAAAQQTQQQKEQNARKAEQELQAYIPTLKGTLIYDHVVTDEMIAKALERYYNGYPELDNPDGSPNIKKIIDYSFRIDNFSGIVRTNVRNSMAKGGSEVAKEVTNASKNFQGSTGGNVGGMTIEEAEKAWMPDMDKTQRN